MVTRSTTVTLTLSNFNLGTLRSVGIDINVDLSIVECKQSNVR
jgi:hypothetical protein